eukprot:m.261536 g.261536  ORF g.261536 m.261536 type:complete len:304 (-) comp24727_c0_seq1:381-1292(-)
MEVVGRVPGPEFGDGIVPVVPARMHAVSVGEQPARGVAQLNVRIAAGLADARPAHVELRVEVCEQLGRAVGGDTRVAMHERLVAEESLLVAKVAAIEPALGAGRATRLWAEPVVVHDEAVDGVFSAAECGHVALNLLHGGVAPVCSHERHAVPRGHCGRPNKLVERAGEIVTGRGGSKIPVRSIADGPPALAPARHAGPGVGRKASRIAVDVGGGGAVRVELQGEAGETDNENGCDRQWKHRAQLAKVRDNQFDQASGDRRGDRACDRTIGSHTSHGLTAYASTPAVWFQKYGAPNSPLPRHD